MAGDEPRFPLNVEFEDSDDGRVFAMIPGIPGAVGIGDTREGARESAMDALRLILEQRRAANS